jgi:phospholipase C
LIAARTPLWKAVPSTYKATVDPVTGKIKKTADRTYADGIATPDGYIVNTAYSVNTPHPGTADVPTNKLVPSLTYATIGDRMNDKGVTWAWYGGGWGAAAAGNPSSGFNYHHHPFAYFKNYAQGTPGRAAHLKDEAALYTDLQNGTMPQVAFFKPDEVENEHPSNSDMRTGDQATKNLINTIRTSSIWNDVVIILTYDENGGLYDHVPPPVIDRWGPGTRIPAMMISPFAKKGFVDKTQYETVSILSFIERRFSLVPLTTRDAAAGDLTTALDMSPPPPPPPPQ